MPIVLVLLMIATSSTTQPFTCEQNGTVGVENVRFLRQNKSEAAVVIDGGPDGNWGNVTAVVDVANHGKIRSDKLVLLASMEALVAPYPLPPELKETTLATEVGWGVIEPERNLVARVLESADACGRQRVELFNIDVDKLLREKFPSEPGRLWPWFIRVKVELLRRDGSTVSRAEQVLRIAPPTPAVGGLLPNYPLSPTHSAVTALAVHKPRASPARSLTPTLAGEPIKERTLDESRIKP